MKMTNNYSILNEILERIDNCREEEQWQVCKTIPVNDYEGSFSIENLTNIDELPQFFVASDPMKGHTNGTILQYEVAWIKSEDDNNHGYGLKVFKADRIDIFDNGEPKDEPCYGEYIFCRIESSAGKRIPRTLEQAFEVLEDETISPIQRQFLLLTTRLLPPQQKNILRMSQTEKEQIERRIADNISERIRSESQLGGYSLNEVWAFYRSLKALSDYDAFDTYIESEFTGPLIDRIQLDDEYVLGEPWPQKETIYPKPKKRFPID